MKRNVWLIAISCFLPTSVISGLFSLFICLFLCFTIWKFFIVINSIQEMDCGYLRHICGKAI